MSDQIITCAGCDTTTDLGIKDDNDLVYLQDIIIEIGWVNKDGYYYCPKCQQESQYLGISNGKI